MSKVASRSVVLTLEHADGPGKQTGARAPTIRARVEITIPEKAHANQQT